MESQNQSNQEYRSIKTNQEDDTSKSESNITDAKTPALIGAIDEEYQEYKRANEINTAYGQVRTFEEDLFEQGGIELESLEANTGLDDTGELFSVREIALRYKKWSEDNRDRFIATLSAHGIQGTGRRHGNIL